MATKYFFDNKEISIPGAYGVIKSGIKNPALALAFGNTLVIDTGLGKFFGGGAGINGTLKSGKDAHYTFDNVRDFRNFVRGGAWWLLAGPMFLPGGGAAAGISSLTYIKAAETVPAEMVIPFGGQDESDSDGIGNNNGSLTIQVKDEGFGGNAVFGDETRAKATITVTNPGANGNIISIVIDGEVVATYTKTNGATIANVVTGLVASVAELGIAEVFSSNATQLVIYAPRGYADNLNGTPPTIQVTGSIAAITTNFSGGVEGTKLTRGYGAKIIAGVIDSSKYILQFWRGTFKGLDTDILYDGTATPLDNIAELSAKAELVVQSPEVSTVQDLVTWMQDASGKGFNFNQAFKLKSYVVASLDQIIDEDLTNSYIKASGGSETFSVDHLNDVLDSISDLNFDFILADKFGDNARSVENLAIQDFIANTAKIKPDLYVAAGDDAGDWSTSNTYAPAFDAQWVTMVHGGAEKIDIGGRAMKQYKAIYKAAALLGREAGIEPQNPLTFKNIGIEGEVHKLTEKQVKQGLDSGILMTRSVGASFEVVKGINTLQNNTYLVNPDGTTHSKQLARISRQLNKEITINAKEALLKKSDGANRNTISPEDVKAWLEGYLASRIAEPGDDNLILSFQNVEVTVNGDAYEITYAFTPNFEVSFLFFTGVIIDPNS